MEGSQAGGLKDFVLPAIISVFFWMVSISYLVLSLAVLDEAEASKEAVGRLAGLTDGAGGDGNSAAANRGLYFTDQNLESARCVPKFGVILTSVLIPLMASNSPDLIHTLQREAMYLKVI